MLFSWRRTESSQSAEIMSLRHDFNEVTERREASAEEHNRLFASEHLQFILFKRKRVFSVSNINLRVNHGMKDKLT